LRGVAVSVMRVADAASAGDVGVVTVADVPVADITRSVAKHAAEAGTEPESGAEKLVKSAVPCSARPGLPPTSRFRM
jgi:hypothetical protein